MLLFVGRIQPLKGADLAIRCAGRARRPEGRARRSSAARAAATAAPSRRGCTRSPTSSGVAGQIHWVRPQRHDRLADYYRAADVCIVPSRSESFGLVALEAAACGTPVVAAAVGGLRSLVDHERDRLPRRGARPGRLRGAGRAAARRRDPRERDGRRARPARSQRYSWSMTAGATAPSLRRSRRARSRALRLSRSRARRVTDEPLDPRGVTARATI